MCYNWHFGSDSYAPHRIRIRILFFSSLSFFEPFLLLQGPSTQGDATAYASLLSLSIPLLSNALLEEPRGDVDKGSNGARRGHVADSCAPGTAYVEGMAMAVAPLEGEGGGEATDQGGTRVAAKTVAGTLSCRESRVRGRLTGGALLHGVSGMRLQGAKFSQIDFIVEQ